VFRDFKTAYDSVRRAKLFNSLIGFGIHIKPVRLKELCLTETYSKIRVDENLSQIFPIKMAWKKRNALSSFLSHFAYNIPVGIFRQTIKLAIKRYTSACGLC
jgi:hypothetical protein